MYYGNMNLFSYSASSYSLSVAGLCPALLCSSICHFPQILWQQMQQLQLQMVPWAEFHVKPVKPLISFKIIKQIIIKLLKLHKASSSNEAGNSPKNVPHKGLEQQ